MIAKKTALCLEELKPAYPAPLGLAPVMTGGSMLPCPTNVNRLLKGRPCSMSVFCRLGLRGMGSCRVLGLEQDRLRLALQLQFGLRSTGSLSVTPGHNLGDAVIDRSSRGRPGRIERSPLERSFRGFFLVAGKRLCDQC